jgi:RHS repeat-associated protein
LGKKSGTKTVWANAFPDGSSLVEEANTEGVKGAIRLDRVPAGDPKWQFELILSDGLTPFLGDGSVERSARRSTLLPILIRDSSGETVATLPTGVAIDALGQEFAVALGLLKAKDGRWVVELTVDKSWLTAPERAYPVLVDPTITLAVWVGGTPNATARDGVIVGRHGWTSDRLTREYGTSGTTELLQTFDLSGLGAGVVPTAARLTGRIGQCGDFFSDFVNKEIQVSPLMSSYQGSVTTIPPSFTAPLSGGTVFRDTYNVPISVSWDVTSWVQNWVSGAWANNGVRFQMSWRNNNGYFCNFYVENLIVDVVNRPPAAALVSPSNNQAGVSNTPTLTASGIDPDGEYPWGFYFSLCYPSFAAPAVCMNSGPNWQPSSAWTVPSAMPWLQAAQWKAWVMDASGAVGESVPWSFTTKADPNAPVLTLVSPAAGATGQLLTPTFTAGATDAQNRALEYQFTVCSATCKVGTERVSPWQSATQWVLPAPPLPGGTAMQWKVQVRAPKAGVPGAYDTTTSIFQSFTTQVVNSAPTGTVLGGPQTPTNGATGVAVQPWFQATATDAEGDAIQFQYRICPPSGACLLSGFVSGAWQVPATNKLLFNTAYTWYAQPRDSRGATGVEVPVLPALPPKFTTGSTSNATVGQFNAISPLTAAVGQLMTSVTNRPVLQARAVDAENDPIEYFYEICAADGAGLFFSPGSQCFRSSASDVRWRTANSWQVNGNLDWNTVYQWRAFARNTNDPTAAPGIAMVQGPQTVIVSTQTVDDRTSSQSGFSPYVEIDGEVGFDGGINEAIGQLTYSKTDVALPGAALGLEVTRTYNGRVRTKGSFGRGWISNLDTRLVYKANQGNLANTSVEVVLPDGRREFFSRGENVKTPQGVETPQRRYVSASSGFYSDLVWTPTAGSMTEGFFTYVLDNRSTFTFENSGRLVEFKDRNGNTLNYDYTAGKLTKIRDPKAGRFLEFTYNAAGLIDRVYTPQVAAHGNASLFTQYTYVGENLDQVCPPTNATVTGCWTYRWESQTTNTGLGERLTKVIKPNGKNEFEVGYDTQSFILQSAVNKAPNPSFEDAATGWAPIVSATVQIGSNASVTTEQALFGSKSLKGQYVANGIPTRVQNLDFIQVEPNRTYAISAFVKGAAPTGSSGNVTPYWQGYDDQQKLIAYSQYINTPTGPTSQSPGTYIVGGSALAESNDPNGFATLNTWTPIRGSFRTSENTKYVRLAFWWENQTAPVYLDGVSLIKGDGLTNRIAWRRNGRGFQTNYNYSFNGANIEVTTVSPRPQITSKSIYNDKFKLESSIDNGGRTVRYEYDSNGFVSKITDPTNRVTQITNDVRGNVLRRNWVWLDRNEYFTYKLDENGNRTDLVDSFRNAKSTPSVDKTTSTDNTYLVTYTYDKPGNRTSETAPPTPADPTTVSRIWSYTDGTEPASPNGLGGVASGTVPKGRLKESSDRTGLLVKYGYDPRGDLVRVDHPQSGVVTYTTDELGRTTSETKWLDGAAYASTNRSFDVRSRVIEETGPSVTNLVTNVAHQSRLKRFYDLNGNPIRTELYDLIGGDPTRTILFDLYDDDDNLKQVTEPLGRVTKFDYDELGNRIRVTDPRGVKMRTDLNDRNLPESTTIENYFDSPTATYVAPTTGTRSIRLNYTTYDNLGRIDSTTDAANRVTKYDYWDDDQLKQTRRLGYLDVGSTTPREVIMGYKEYDKIGNVTKVRTGTTENVAMTYDARGFVIEKVVDPGVLNRVTKFDVDREGRLLKSTTGRFVTENTLGAASKLVASTKTFGVGASIGYKYDTLGRLKTVTSGRSFDTTYTYDQLGRTVKVESPNTTVWTAGVSAIARPTVTQGYNTFGEQTHNKDERGFVTTTTRNDLGQAAVITYPTDNTVTPAVTPTESFLYDFAGNSRAVIDRRSQQTDYTIDALGRVRLTTQPAPVASGPRPTTSVAFDDVSQQTQVVDPNGVTTKASWDVLGRQRTSSIVVTQKANAEWTTTFDYNDAGRPTLRRDPRGKSWTTPEYNGAGQPKRTVDPTGAVTVTTYEEPTGWMSTVTDGMTLLSNSPIGGTTRTKSTYDDAGRLVKTESVHPTTDVVLATHSYGYDFDSNQTTHTRPTSNGTATDTTIYDELGRVSGSSNQLEASIFSTASAGFDAAGNQVRIVDPRSNITTATYNSWNLLTSTTEPSTAAHPALADRTWSVKYSPAGDPKNETRPGGVIVDRTYDLLGRMTAETGSGTGALSATRSFGYDPGGRMTSAGTQSFTYFDTGNLKDSTGPAGTSSFDIDAASRIVSRTDAAGTSTFGYNDRGDLNAYNVGGTPVTIDWRTDGLVDKINYPLAITRMFGYDDMGRITDDYTKTSANATLARREYTYNPDSSVKSAKITASGGGVTPPGTIEPGFIPSTASGSRDVLVTATYVYWTNLNTGSIGRANLDGTGVNQNFIAGIDAPSGIATDGTYLYWTTGGLNDTYGTGGIGRALLDGTSRNNTFITGASKPIGLAVTNANIYWTNFNGSTIGRAALNGTGVNQSFIQTNVNYLYGLEARGNYLYWTYFITGTAANGTNIGRADIGGTNINTAFITGTNAPGGITSDSTYLYWANLTSIGRSKLDGTGVNQNYIGNTFPGPGTTASPVGIVADATRLYFTNQASQKVARVTSGGAVGGPSQDYSYTYDLGSRLKGFTGPTGSTTYTYDLAANRLTENGTSFVYDERNRITSGAGLTYNWSPRGSLNSTTGTGGTTYTFDGLDRMTGAGGVTYTYDSLDRVLSRNGAAPFAYAGTETDPVAEGTNLYRRSPGGSLLGLSRAGVSVLTGLERHGDLAFTLNPTTGVIADTVVNDPFGKTLSFTGSKPNTGFQGDYTDPTNNLVWMAARWYNPGTGTFTTRDTYPGSVGAYGTINRYTYGLNDPVRYWDPTGKFGELAVGLFGSLLQGARSFVSGNDSSQAEAQIRYLGGDSGISLLNSMVVSAAVQSLGTAVGEVATSAGDLFDPLKQLASAVSWTSSKFVLRLGTLLATDDDIAVINPEGVRDSGCSFGTFQRGIRQKTLTSCEMETSKLNGASDLDFKMSYLAADPRNGLSRATNGVCEGGVQCGVVSAFLSSLTAKRIDPAIRSRLSSILGHRYCDEIAEFCRAENAFSAKLVELTNSVVVGGFLPGAMKSNTNPTTSPACPGNSFTPETRVLMADGTTKRIEDVAVGDMVLATDPETGKSGPHTVTALIIGEGKKRLIDVVVETDEGLKTIVATWNHDFWVDDQGRWLRADRLEHGDDLLAPTGGRVTVVSTSEHIAYRRVHNLTVAGVHSYYVLAGQQAVLVHNDGEEYPSPLPTQKQGKTQSLTNAQAKDLAEYNGYRDTGRVLKGEKIFTDGKNFIVQDTTSHSGGTWKIAKSERALGSKTTRTATTDALLKPIGC